MVLRTYTATDMTNIVWYYVHTLQLIQQVYFGIKWLIDVHHTSKQTVKTMIIICIVYEGDSNPFENDQTQLINTSQWKTLKKTGW